MIKECRRCGQQFIQQHPFEMFGSKLCRELSILDRRKQLYYLNIDEYKQYYREHKLSTIKLCQECGYPFKVRYSNDKCGSLLCKEINKRKHFRTSAMNYIRKYKFSILHKNYYLKNRDVMYQKSREYLKNNPIRRKIGYINWINKHRDKELKRLREWKRNNKDKHSEINRRWKQKNKFKLVLYEAKRRAKEVKLNFDEEEWKTILNKYEGRCYYCGCKLYKRHEEGFIKTQELTMDHLISVNKNGKTVVKNIVPACLSHNSSKQDLSEDEFIEYIRKDIGNPNWVPFGMKVKMNE